MTAQHCDDHLVGSLLPRSSRRIFRCQVALGRLLDAHLNEFTFRSILASRLIINGGLSSNDIKIICQCCYLNYTWNNYFSFGNSSQILIIKGLSFVQRKLWSHSHQFVAQEPLFWNCCGSAREYRHILIPRKLKEPAVQRERGGRIWEGCGCAREGRGKLRERGSTRSTKIAPPCSNLFVQHNRYKVHLKTTCGPAQ